MESVADGEALEDSILRLFAGLEVWVNVFNLIENGRGLVSVDIAFLVVCFEGIAFYDEEGVIVESGNLRGFPGEEVHVYMSVPLSDDCGFASVHHEEAVEDDNDGPVGVMGAASDVDDG